MGFFRETCIVYCVSHLGQYDYIYLFFCPLLYCLVCMLVCMSMLSCLPAVLVCVDVSYIIYLLTFTIICLHLNFAEVHRFLTCTHQLYRPIAQ